MGWTLPRMAKRGPAGYSWGPAAAVWLTYLNLFTQVGILSTL